MFLQKKQVGVFVKIIHYSIIIFVWSLRFKYTLTVNRYTLCKSRIGRAAAPARNVAAALVANNEVNSQTRVQRKKSN